MSLQGMHVVFSWREGGREREREGEGEGEGDLRERERERERETDRERDTERQREREESEKAMHERQQKADVWSSRLLASYMVPEPDTVALICFNHA